ncbi:hypothetical protein HAZT_HAZT009017 [Hyalella azteca]|uniref:Protein tyrosine phosphatase type IVA 3 n=1 Tax=Hyalella azteca TaxID=294128 RepID=A0A6A0GX78_HYAAZ|nr:hypothetical protein HAZT_HAZT009017 [Hyalella azteca]
MNGGGITATPGGRDSISSGGGAPPPQAFAPRVGKNIRPAPSEIEFKDMKFLITDRPSDATMVAYIEELCRHSVKDVVRVCEPTYQTDLLAQHGITVTNLVFDDGTAPPAQVGYCPACPGGLLPRLPRWVTAPPAQVGYCPACPGGLLPRLLRWVTAPPAQVGYCPTCPGSGGVAVTNPSLPRQVVEEWLSLVRARRAVGTTVAVHCVAGLGRAPVLVAIALMELGMRYEDAVQHIRTKRRGAINAKQLAYLEKYRPKGRLKNGKTATACCVQ